MIEHKGKAPNIGMLGSLNDGVVQTIKNYIPIISSL